MTDRQAAKLSMYQEVAKVCHANQQVYAEIPAMMTAVSKIDESIASILQVAGQQSGTVSQGVTAEKNKALDAMTNESLKIGNMIYVYALDNNNLDLLTRMTINKSMFYNSHVSESIIRAHNIANEAESHLAELAEYGVTLAGLDKLNESIAALETIVNNPRITIDEHKVYTANIKQLFAKTDSILHDRLDKLVTLFKDSAPDFYALYKNARNVIDTAKRSRKPEE